VVKPSEFTPIILERTRALFEEAGLPRGLFGVVQGKGDVGAELIRSGVNMIVFTGSVATGRKVNLAAAEQMIPCVLELGGKDPAIVFPDADLDAAAKKIAWGAFANSGQTCASVERVYVHESVAKPFTEKVVALAGKLRQGEPNQYDVDLGAMTTQLQVEIVRRHLEDARQRGAKILTGGEIQLTPDGARFVQPTVLTDATPDMAIVREETFGPMLPIMTYRTEEEAVRLANDSTYGLSAYVFTRDRARAERIANHLGDLGALGNDAGFAFGLAQFSRLKEIWLRALDAVLGQRYLNDFVVPGGVARDAREELLPRLADCARGIAVEAAAIRAIYDEHAGVRDRFVEAGTVTPDLARRLGLIGLAGRASGQAFDLRVDLPCAPYAELAVAKAGHEEGDVAARVAVRFDELAESARLVREIVDRLPAGSTRVEVAEPSAGANGIGVVEGWRGPVMVALVAGAGGDVHRCHPHDPSWQNWSVLEHAIIGNIVPDFPLINKSFNLSYSGHDL